MGFLSSIGLPQLLGSGVDLIDGHSGNFLRDTAINSVGAALFAGGMDLSGSNFPVASGSLSGISSPSPVPYYPTSVPNVTSSSQYVSALAQPPSFTSQYAPWVMGGLGFLGNMATNSANAQQALDNRDFQLAMSSSSYQRAMHSMDSAGLNPILAYAQGGASTPSGAQAVMSNDVTPAVQAYSSTAQTNSAVNLQQEQAQLAAIQGDLAAGPTYSNILSQTNLNQQQLLQLSALVQQIQAQTTLLQNEATGSSQDAQTLQQFPWLRYVRAFSSHFPNFSLPPLVAP